MTRKKILFSVVFLLPVLFTFLFFSSKDALASEYCATVTGYHATSWYCPSYSSQYPHFSCAKGYALGDTSQNYGSFRCPGPEICCGRLPVPTPTPRPTISACAIHHGICLTRIQGQESGYKMAPYSCNQVAKFCYYPTYGFNLQNLLNTIFHSISLPSFAFAK